MSWVVPFETKSPRIGTEYAKYGKETKIKYVIMKGINIFSKNCCLFRIKLINFIIGINGINIAVIIAYCANACEVLNNVFIIVKNGLEKVKINSRKLFR